MKSITLAILLILLISRIKNTPANLCKKIWERKIQKSIEKNKKLNEFDEDKIKMILSCSIILVFFIQTFLIIFYAILGTHFNSTYMIILSALQILSSLYSMKVMFSFDKESLILNIKTKDYKFRRLNLLLNVIIDYLYYPAAIYILLNNL